MTRKPQRPYTVRFELPSGPREVRVDPSKPPESGSGEPFSLLDVAMDAGVDIDHACGGVSACSTCHLVVTSGLETCGEMEDAELDQLDKAPGQTMQSRLACQCVPDGTRDVVARIPSWNRNLVREGR